MKPITSFSLFIFSYLFCTCGVTAQIIAEGFEWQTQEHIQGIELATALDSEGTSWVKVSTKVEAKYWSLLNLLRDTESASEWVDNARQVTLLQRPDYRTDIVYTVMHAPWPFADREMVTLSSLVFDIEKATLTIKVQQSHDYPVNKKHVVMENIRGSWQAEQVSIRDTMITWTGTGVAGGSIPDWLAISQLQSSTFKTFENLRRKITATKYQGKPLAYQIYEEKSLFIGEER